MPPESTTFVALVPAAGSGSRYGVDGPKQLLQIAGKPVVAWTVERLLACGAKEVVAALPDNSVGEGLASSLSDPRVLCIPGGSTRQDSVERCLAMARGSAGDLVLVHDGARPAVSEEDIRAVLEAGAATGAAILGRRVHDTIKKIENGSVVGTIDRQSLFRAETPQVFRREVLERAYEAAARAGLIGTDEASLVEALGDVDIRAVDATRPNPKLTHPRDLPFVASLLVPR